MFSLASHKFVCSICINVTLLCNTHEHILGLSTYGTISGMNGTRQQKRSFSMDKEDAMDCCATICSFSKWKIWSVLTVTVWHRNWRLFWLHRWLNAFEVLSHWTQGLRVHWKCKIWYIYIACMSHTLNWSWAIQCFKHGNAFEICNRIIFNFYIALCTFS